MPQPASIEADDYSGWDGDDAPVAAGLPASAEGSTPLEPMTIVAGDEADGSRLDKWLATRLPMYSRSRIQRWIGDGRVRIAGRVVAVRDAVWKGDEVRVEPQPGDDESAYLPEDIALDVVHEDDDVLVIDKPAGRVVHPAVGNWSGTILNGLLHRFPSIANVPRAGIVHRLDKDTTGLMVVAKTVVAQTDLVRQLQARTVGRSYVALVHGTPPPSGRIAWPIGRDPRGRTRMAAFKPSPGGGDPPAGTKAAATRFETLAAVEIQGGHASLIVCRLETGRTHQIRVHLQALGHPLLGDPTYGRAGEAIGFDRQALHAWRLRFVHPRTGDAMGFEAALPADLAALATRLGFDTGRSLASAERGDA